MRRPSFDRTAGTWSLLDQALVSGSNFLIGILLARSLGLAAFGAYVIAQTYLLYANTFQSALVVSPMMTAVPAEGRPARQRHLLRGFFAYMLAVLLVTAMGVQALAALLGHWVPTLDLGPLAGPLAAAMAGFQLQDWLRRTLYVQSANRFVFAADLVAYGGQFGVLATLAALQQLTPALALWAMAGCFAVSALGIMAGTRLWPNIGSAREVIVLHWRSSRDFLASWQLQWVGSAGVILIGSGFIGPQAAGAIKAVQNLLGPVNVFFQWMDNVVPVRAALRAKQGGVHALANYLARLNGIGLLALGGATVLLLAVDDWLMLRLYGADYQPYAVLVVYQAAYYLFGHAYRMQSYFNRTLGQTEVLARASGFWALGSVLFALAAVPLWQERGIMLALVVGEVVALAYLLWWRGQARHGSAGSRFALVPLPSGASLLLPMANRAVMRSVLSMYFPSRWTGRVYRQLVKAMLPAWGLLGLGRTSAGPDVLIQHLPRLLPAVPGAQAEHVGALVAGSGDKLTIILMDAHGQALAYARLASSPAAMAAVLQEARMLTALLGTAAARHVPRVLDQGALESPEAFFLTESAGPDNLSPQSLGRPHFVFLSGLLDKTAPAHWDGMVDRLALDCGPLLGLADFAEPVSAALTRLRAMPALALPTCMEHGDFAPWNIRQSVDGGLFVLDWESARLAGLPWLDALHFCHQVHALVRREPPAQVLQQLQAVFALPCAEDYAVATGFVARHAAPLIMVYLLTNVLADHRLGRHAESPWQQARLSMLKLLCAEKHDET